MGYVCVFTGSVHPVVPARAVAQEINSPHIAFTSAVVAGLKLGGTNANATPR